MAGTHHSMANNLLDHSNDHIILMPPQTIQVLFSLDSLQLLNMAILLNPLPNFLLTAAGRLVKFVEKPAIKPWTVITEWTLHSKAATHLLNWLPWLPTL
jgi:hypothetical protein